MESTKWLKSTWQISVLDQVLPIRIRHSWIISIRVLVTTTIYFLLEHELSLEIDSWVTSSRITCSGSRSCFWLKFNRTYSLVQNVPWILRFGTVEQLWKLVMFIFSFNNDLGWRSNTYKFCSRIGFLAIRLLHFNLPLLFFKEVICCFAMCCSVSYTLQTLILDFSVRVSATIILLDSIFAVVLLWQILHYIDIILTIVIKLVQLEICGLDCLVLILIEENSLWFLIIYTNSQIIGFSI